MAGFLYFVPTAQTEKQAYELLRAGGAGHATEGVVTKTFGPGPDGSGGILAPWSPVTKANRAGNCVYREAEQEWRKSPIGGDEATWWLGWWKADPPTPDDLARERQIQGHLVELADGNRWLIPVARRYRIPDDADQPQWLPAFPCRRELGADGKFTPGDVVEPYRKLWDYIEPMLKAFGPNADGEIAFDDICQFQVEALRLNYRVSTVEVWALGLLDSAMAAHDIFNAVADGPGLKELLGKVQAPDGGSTSPGAEVS